MPRPIARGSSPIGAGTTDRTFFDGILVLSDVPPKVGEQAATLGGLSGGRYDLRPSTAITAPNVTAGGIVYPWGGAQSSQGLCIGVVLYVDVDTVNNCLRSWPVHARFRQTGGSAGTCRTRRRACSSGRARCLRASQLQQQDRAQALTSRRRRLFLAVARFRSRPFGFRCRSWCRIP